MGSKPTSAEELLASYRLLIVEDSEASLIFLKQELRTIGFKKIQFATNGREGLEKAKDSVLMGAPYDLIISDINMPQMDGLTMFERFQTERDLKDIPLLVISAEKDMSKVLRAVNLGVSQYIIKPYNRNELQEKIISVIKS